VAKLYNLPLVLHEQNSAPGLTNKFLASLADLVLVGFPEAIKALGEERSLYVGNPVRSEIGQLAGVTREYKSQMVSLLAVGGSQGSKRLNEAVREVARALTEKKQPFKLVHQTGAADLEETKAFYAALGLSARVEAFITDMASVYREADLAITRAGALTLAELTAAKLPALLVPLPTAAGDHQTANARAMEELGLCRLVPEKELAGGALTQLTLELVKAPAKLAAMSEKATPLAVRAASVGPEMARLCLEVLAKKTGLVADQTSGQTNGLNK
jgi:UDP-N-acetylglucosamine--N-acetylmuramyl-(pentapeptide) pyrophosphoryl-undecaprenol N-acetylglucosamine transferase